MTSQPETPTPFDGAQGSLAAPSLASLAKTTAVALVVAGAILITIVLPAEYAIDPVGTGRWLGLTQIAAPALNPVDIARPEGAPLVPTQKGPIGEYPNEFKLDVFEVALAPYEYVEYKYRMEKGSSMLYSWKASAAVVHDFHGERTSDTNDGGPAEESFDKTDRRQSTGSYVAPFPGIHGWYWENTSAEPVTIRLTSAGFYSSAVEIRSDRTRHPHPLRPLDSLPVLPNASASGTQ
jgi:hypothetical protein